VVTAIADWIKAVPRRQTRCAFAREQFGWRAANCERVRKERVRN